METITMDSDVTVVSVTMETDYAYETTTMAAPKMLMDMNQKRIAMEIQKYLFPVLVVVGTIGHVLTVTVLIRPRMRYTSIYFYLIVLACSDAIVLWLSCFRSWLMLVSGFELMYVYDAMCKGITFFYLSSTYLSSWLIVCMTIDRFIAVWFPLKVAVLCSIRHARMSTLILVILSAASNLHVFWTFQLTIHKKKPSCTYDMNNFFMMHMFEYVKLASYCFVPFVIVLLLNSGIIYKLQWGSSMIRRPNSRHANRTSESSHTHDKIISLLLTISFTWFFLTLPVSLLGFIPFMHNNAIIRIICFLLMYTNHSINFYLYCLTGKKFRHELREVFFCLKKSGSGHTIQNGGDFSKTTTKTDIQEKIPLASASNNFYTGMEDIQSNKG